MKPQKSLRLNTDQIIEYATAFQVSKILFSAVEFDIFNIIGRKRLSAEEISSVCNLPLRSLKRLLNGATCLNLIHFKDGKFFNSLQAMKYLIKGKLEYIGDLITVYNRLLYDKWGELEEAIKTDKFHSVLGSKGDTLANIAIDPKMTWRVMMAQHNYSIKAAEELVHNFDFSKHNMLLDLGGGTGIFSIMAAKKFKKMKAVIFDFPQTCKIADEIISMYKLRRRIKTHPGNILRDSFPPGADVILISGVLDGYNEENCRKIIAKAYEYLLTGGVIIIKESIIHDNRSGPLFPVLFSLALLIETEGGDTRSRGEMTQWLKDIGFKRIKYKTLTGISGKFRNMGMLTAVK